MATVFKPKGRVKYVIQYFDENGRRRKALGCTDKPESERIANRLENEVTLRRAGLLDRKSEAYRDHEAKPLADHSLRFLLPSFEAGPEALRDNVVNYVCRDRADRLWQFGMRSKPACRPRRTAVRGCMLVDTRKPGRPTCGLRKTCRSVG